jgi:hypothetical protein
MRLDSRPENVGDICWQSDYGNRMLSPISQVGAEATDWFLATHSPIVCEDDVGKVEEHGLFAELFAASKPETLVVIKGAPGAGKSQLINWLKLRFDDALARGDCPGVGERSLRSVLIRRRSGSLKDALQQLVDQLPEYQRYLAKIQAAISDMSGDTANRRLYTEMQLSLYESRHASAPRLRFLDEVFNDSGAVHWLCRGGGAIDRNIKRLIEESDPSARESLPPFTADDFNFPVNARLGFDEDLRDRLADDENIREQAAIRANDHLRLAIAGLTGLRGHTLNEIFQEIRQEMRRRGEALALFVEDVSTLSVLDEELVNAVQPLNEPSMCPLISVLGMTLPAYDRLPDNLKGRIDRALEITGSSSLHLEDTKGETTDRFVARYLNGLRAGPQQAKLLAEDVRSYGDQRHSACEDCRLKPECFHAFGFVRFDEAEVGLYPLSSGASRRLLDGLTAGQTLKTPRTLLQHVVRPLLDNVAKEFRGGTVGIPVQPQSPVDLGAEQDNLLAGWTAEERGRISYLLYYWTGFDKLRDGASHLAPMLPWFRHSNFAKKVAPLPGTAPQLPDPPVPRPAPRVGPTGVRDTPKRFKELIQRLDSWFLDKQALKGDGDFRALLLEVVRNSIQLEEVRSPTCRVQDLSTPLKTSNIVIEGMTTKAAVATKARFTFERTQDVYEMLRDLIAFEHLGNASWEFDGGDQARRRYGQWLTQHVSELVRGYEPATSDPSDRGVALRAGIRFLRSAYRFAARKDLPSDTGAAIEAIVSFTPSAPFALSESARAVALDLPQRFKEMRDFLLEELAVRQGGGGGGGGLNYIDPRPLIEHLSSSSEDLSLGSSEVSINTVDYPAVGRLASSRWAKLQDVLEEERQALSALTDSLVPHLRNWGLSTESLPVSLREYLESARGVVKACEGANESLGDPTLQAQIRDLAPAAVSRYVSPVERALQVLESSPQAVLTLDIREVQNTVDFVVRVDRAIQRLQQSLQQRLSDVVTEQDVETSRHEAIATIHALARVLANAPTEAEADA